MATAYAQQQRFAEAAAAMERLLTWARTQPEVSDELIGRWTRGLDAYRAEAAKAGG